MGQEDVIMEQDVADSHNPAPAPANSWCCLYQVLSLQDDFANKKPMIQHYIES